MILNPELRRHLWLDFSPQKLMLTPLVIAAILFLCYLTEKYSVKHIAYLIFLFYFYIIGTKAASESIADEIDNRTWDYQRLSVLPPWTLSWGKLLGSTAYAWYGAMIAWIPYAFLSLQTESLYLVLIQLIILLLGGVLAQASALLLSMNALHWEKNTKTGTFLYLLFGLWIAYGITHNTLTLFTHHNQSSYSFYGITLSKITFYFISLSLFLIWSLIGLYRRMRSALQYPSFPWVWFMFTLFCMLYGGHFFNQGTINTHFFSHSSHSIERLDSFYTQGKAPQYAALLMASFLTYAALFCDKININFYKKIYSKITHKNFKNITVPAWIASFSLVIGMGVWLSFSPSFSLDISEANQILFIPAVFMGAWILFLSRDILLIHYFKGSESPKRGSMAALFYLALLYILIPSLLVALRAPSFLMIFFLPTSLHHWLFSLLAPMVEILFLGWVIKKINLK